MAGTAAKDEAEDGTGSGEAGGGEAGGGEVPLLLPSAPAPAPAAAVPPADAGPSAAELKKEGNAAFGRGEFAVAVRALHPRTRSNGYTSDAIHIAGGACVG